MVSRAQVVSEARSWLGTRYRHQAHMKGVATDCGGLVYSVGLALGLLPPVASLPEAGRFKGYGRVAHNGSLVDACELLLEPVAIEVARAGDVVLLKFNVEPQHVAILADYKYGGLSLIHAYAHARKVVEARLDEAWTNRIHAAYRFPGVEA